MGLKDLGVELPTDKHSKSQQLPGVGGGSEEEKPCYLVFEHGSPPPG